MKLPKLKKKVNDFLIGEKGSISKKAIITAGVALVASSQVIQAAHTNNIPSGGVDCGISPPPGTTNTDGTSVPNPTPQHANETSIKSTGTVVGSHSHCIQSHANHGSHGSHGSHCNCDCSGWN